MNLRKKKKKVPDYYSIEGEKWRIIYIPREVEE